MAMYAYPASLPREEIGVILAALGNPAALTGPDVRQAGWVVIGFGLSLAGSHPPMVMAEAGDQTEVLKKHLTAAVAMHDSGDTQGAVPWGIIVPLLVDLILKFLKR